MEVRHWNCLSWFYRNHPEHLNEYIESVSPKQIECKKWLVDELLKIPNDFSDIQLYGGWYGYPLIDMLNDVFDINSLYNIDCDNFATAACHRMSKHYFKHPFVKTITKNVEDYTYHFQYPPEREDIKLVINTSSEHMPHLPELVKNKKYNKTCVFALQSNNMFDLEEHVNCVNSEDELIEKSEISHVLYSGTRSFSYEKNQVSKNYERYMVIGLRDMWT